MAPVVVDPDKVREFADAASFYRWLGEHHDRADEVWIKIHKLSSANSTSSRVAPPAPPWRRSSSRSMRNEVSR